MTSLVFKIYVKEKCKEIDDDFCLVSDVIGSMLPQSQIKALSWTKRNILVGVWFGFRGFFQSCGF